MFENDFKFVVPADMEKAQDGSWKVRGLASTSQTDQQGETIIQSGIDLTPIDKRKGVLNWDHKKGPENTIGVLDGYKRGEQGLYIEGRLFKKHTKAKAVKEIMESLGEADHGRMGLSVEGKILERDKMNPKIIKKCQISAVALTMNPVNVSTYADIVKSMNSAEELEIDAVETAPEASSDEVTFTASQVVTMIQKALGVGAGYTQAPADRTGGDALSQQSIDAKKKKVEKGEEDECPPEDEKTSGSCRKLKKMSKAMYKSNLEEIVGKLSALYPDVDDTNLLIAVGERLKTRFPDIEESFGKGIRIKQQDPKEREHKLYEDARQRSDYEENKDKTRTQLAEIARDSGAGAKEKQQIRAQRDAAIQAGEDRDHVRPGI